MEHEKIAKEVTDAIERKKLAETIGAEKAIVEIIAKEMIKNFGVGALIDTIYQNAYEKGYNQGCDDGYEGGYFNGYGDADSGYSCDPERHW